MKPSPTLPALALACVLVLGACGGDGDDLTDAAEDRAATSEPAGADDSDGVPELFALGACDTLTAGELDAAGFEPEPSNTADVAGSSTGNVCWWEGGLGNSRTAMVGFGLSDLDADYFEEVIDEQETEIDGRPARRITGRDDLEAVDPIPACAVRVEVESGVILDVEVGVSQTEHASTEDQPRLTEACAILDSLVPKVTAHIAGRPSSAGDDAAGDGDSATGSTIPADAEITSDLLCGVLANTEIPAQGFDLAQPAPQDSTADAMCTWESIAGNQPQVDLWYSATGVSSPDGDPLETDGRDGAIVPGSGASQCRAEFERPPGTVVIELYRVDDACQVAEDLAQLLAPRFPD